MQKDYKILNDGTIFEIKEDGSIAKLAKIDNHGNFSTINGEVLAPKSGGKGGLWFFLIVFAIAAIVLGVLYAEANENYSIANKERNEYQNKYESASSATSSLHSEISSLKQERDDAKSELSNLKNKVGRIYPLIITDIQIANVYYDGDIETDFGKTIYDYNTMYLKPRIKYIGLDSGNKTIKVKWYNPDGTIRQGTSSPSGFSQSQSMYVYSGDNNTYTLSGWGNSSKGHWRSGTYRFEIWYEDSCIKSKTFTIY